MRFSTTLISLDSKTFVRVLSMINSYGWNIYNSKFGVFVSDRKCENMREVMESNHVGIKFLTSRVIKIIKKLEKSDEAKKYNTLYDPKVLISDKEVEIFTTENGVKFKNLTNSVARYETVNLIDLEGRTIW